MTDAKPPIQSGDRVVVTDRYVEDGGWWVGEHGTVEADWHAFGSHGSRRVYRVLMDVGDVIEFTSAQVSLAPAQVFHPDAA